MARGSTGGPRGGPRGGSRGGPRGGSRGGPRGGPQGGDGVDRTDPLARAAERLTERLERKAADLDRHAAKIAQKVDALDRVNDRLASIDLWMRGIGGGRRPRFTNEDVRVAAIAIADAEGLDALSMRRVATELEAPTMTLYYYVRTKDELLSLIVDAVMGEVVLGPDDVMPDGWQAALAFVATRSRDAILRHPWFSNIHDGPSLGPNAVRHFDQSLQALADLDQPFDVKLDIISAVDEYVFGYCSQAADTWPIEDFSELRDYVTALLREGSYPQVEAVMADLGVDGTWAVLDSVGRDDVWFDRNLRRFIDGIARSLLPL